MRRRARRHWHEAPSSYRLRREPSSSGLKKRLLFESVPEDHGRPDTQTQKYVYLRPLCVRLPLLIEQSWTEARALFLCILLHRNRLPPDTSHLASETASFPPALSIQLRPLFCLLFPDDPRP